MKPTLVYHARVEDDGTLKIFRRSEFLSDLNLFFQGSDIEIIVRKKYKKRTLPMNAYYWGVVVPCVNHGLRDVGYMVTAQQTHEMLKDLFAKDIIANRETGEVIEIPGSTANMNTSQMMDYWAQIRQWAREYLNIEIPEPGEQTKIEFHGNSID